MSDPDLKSQVTTSRECARQILELANSGLTRASFLKTSIRRIAEAFDCDAVRVVLRDRGRRFCVDYDRALHDKAVLDVASESALPETPPIWTTGSSQDLEEVCRKLVNSRFDPSLPWFTDSGDLCIEDSANFPDWNRWLDGNVTGPGLHLSKDCRSLLIIPLDGTRKRLGLIQLESKRAGFFEGRHAEKFDRIAQTFGFAVDLRNVQVALRERVKELTCLYSIARLVVRSDLSLDEVLQSAAEILPPGWLYPDIAAARIVLGNRVYATVGADRMVQSMSADLYVENKQCGLVEVGYTEEKPPIDEGPFLLEERELIDTIARELAFVIEQKSHADEKEQLQAQLRHADRLATIGQLAAGVAHELNEPLATIMGFAQLAAKQAGIPDNAARDMNKIVTAALHARGIIKELLVFAREARPIKVMFNLNDLIRDGLFFLEARFVKAGISLLCELDENLPDMRADRSQMLQVLTNLIVNSVQAMPNGGRLTIKTAQHENHVQLVIIDTGCGMDENTVKNIFHPFFSTKDVDAGTGLGLSVVHGIVASHQGRIEVESRPGRGTRFCLTLPLNTAESTSES